MEAEAIVAEVEKEGYCIVKNAVSLEFCEEILVTELAAIRSMTIGGLSLQPPRRTWQLLAGSGRQAAGSLRQAAGSRRRASSSLPLKRCLHLFRS